MFDLSIFMIEFAKVLKNTNSVSYLLYDPNQWFMVTDEFGICRPYFADALSIWVTKHHRAPSFKRDSNFIIDGHREMIPTGGLEHHSSTHDILIFFIKQHYIFGQNFQGDYKEEAGKF